LGLYLGAALTAGWLIGTGLWRRGLPSRRLFPLHAAILLAAMLGGVHMLDFGPTWRVLCGLWTGHVVIVWLLGGGRELWLGTTGGISVRASCVRVDTSRQTARGTRRHEIHWIAAVAVVTALGLLVPQLCATAP
jgi:hypothetical protein